MLLIDTTIMIDFLRGHPGALNFLKNLREEAALSALNVAELMVGRMKGKEEAFIQGLQERHEIFPVDLEIAMLGGLYQRQYGPSHGSGVVDCLLAATAVVKKCRFVTHNVKHFSMLRDVLVPYRS